MVNGSDVIKYEERNQERLQSNFLESKGYNLDEEYPESEIESLFEDDDYWKFVAEDMNGT